MKSGPTSCPSGSSVAHFAREAGLPVAQQKGITVYYNDIVVGEYVADLVVHGRPSN